jgi:hypothetical protein
MWNSGPKTAEMRPWRGLDARQKYLPIDQKRSMREVARPSLEHDAYQNPVAVCDTQVQVLSTNPARSAAESKCQFALDNEKFAFRCAIRDPFAAT